MEKRIVFGRGIQFAEWVMILGKFELEGFPN